MISYKFFSFHHQHYIEIFSSKMKQYDESILAGKQHHIEQIKEKRNKIINKNNDDDDELRWQ